jgi:plasmid stabilization system protein ParE
VTPGFFEAMSVKLVHGRFFDDRDATRGPTKTAIGGQQMSARSIIVDGTLVMVEHIVRTLETHKALGERESITDTIGHAAQEVESTYAWYAAWDVAAARGFREELRQAVDAVAASPQTWPRYWSRARRYVFPRYPFSLIYIVRGEALEIVAVAHGRRRPGYWRSRLRNAV